MRAEKRCKHSLRLFPRLDVTSYVFSHVGTVTYFTRAWLRCKFSSAQHQLQSFFVCCTILRVLLAHCVRLRLFQLVWALSSPNSRETSEHLKSPKNYFNPVFSTYSQVAYESSRAAATPATCRNVVFSFKKKNQGPQIPRS